MQHTCSYCISFIRITDWLQYPHFANDPNAYFLAAFILLNYPKLPSKPVIVWLHRFFRLTFVYEKNHCVRWYYISHAPMMRAPSVLVRRIQSV